MKITRNSSGLISVNGKAIDIYSFCQFLVANKLGTPAGATDDIISEFLHEKEFDPQTMTLATEADIERMKDELSMLNQIWLILDLESIQADQPVAPIVE